MKGNNYPQTTDFSQTLLINFYKNYKISHMSEFEPLKSVFSYLKNHVSNRKPVQNQNSAKKFYVEPHFAWLIDNDGIFITYCNNKLPGLMLYTTIKFAHQLSI